MAGKAYDFYTFDIVNIPEEFGEETDYLDFAKDPNLHALHDGIEEGFWKVWQPNTLVI